MAWPEELVLATRLVTGLTGAGRAFYSAR